MPGHRHKVVLCSYMYTGYPICRYVHIQETEQVPTAFKVLSCHQAFFQFGGARKKTNARLGGQSVSQADSRVTILSRSSEKRTPDRRLSKSENRIMRTFRVQYISALLLLSTLFYFIFLLFMLCLYMKHLRRH